jgi:hypothetical protein
MLSTVLLVRTAFGYLLCSHYVQSPEEYVVETIVLHGSCQSRVGAEVLHLRTSRDLPIVYTCYKGSTVGEVRSRGKAGVFALIVGDSAIPETLENRKWRTCVHSFFMYVRTIVLRFRLF